MSMSLWSENDMLTPALASDSIVVTRKEGWGRIFCTIERDEGPL